MSDSRTHCRRCRYPLQGLRSDRCPECGEPLHDPAAERRAAAKMPLLIVLAIADVSMLQVLAAMVIALLLDPTSASSSWLFIATIVGGAVVACSIVLTVRVWRW